MRLHGAVDLVRRRADKTDQIALTGLLTQVLEARAETEAGDSGKRQGDNQKGGSHDATRPIARS